MTARCLLCDTCRTVLCELPGPAKRPLHLQVVCLDTPPASAQLGGLAASEPDGWPPLLEVLPLIQSPAPTALARLASAHLPRVLQTCEASCMMHVQVRSRIATTLLTGQKLPALARQDVAVRRLAPEGPSHRHAFIRFMQVCMAGSVHRAAARCDEPAV
jgi:hypothetical protein